MIAWICDDIKIYGVMDVNAYAYLRGVTRPEVVLLYKEKEHAEAIVENQSSEQAVIYTDGSVRN